MDGTVSGEEEEEGEDGQQISHDQLVSFVSVEEEEEDGLPIIHDQFVSFVSAKQPAVE